MAVSVTVWDGAGTIGGNKILLQADGRNVFLDFGTTFATRNKYYQDFLSPRSGRGLLDPLFMGLIPPIPGIYRSDMEPPGTDLWSRIADVQPGLELDGVLLSHAHLDHSGYISFLRGDIPVFTSNMSAVICKSMQDCGGSDFECETCYLVKRVEKEGGVLGTSGGPAEQRPFRIVGESAIPPHVTEFWDWAARKTRLLNSQELGLADNVNGLPLRRFPVDHSIFGAGAFAIETSAGWIVYTGDLRCHGAHGNDTARFAEAVSELKPALLICEGTHVDRERCITEEEVYANALACAQSAVGKLVIADFGPRNVERLLTFLRISEQAGRRLVITAKDAFLLSQMQTVSDAVPDLKGTDTVAVFVEPRARADKWEQDYVRGPFGDKLVTSAEIHASQGDFVLCFSFFDVNDLVDIDPDPDGVYIYSSSEAYSEEQEFDLQRLANWLDRFAFRSCGLKLGSSEAADETVPLHASGHISGPELLSLIRTIAPRAIVPVHTERPEFFVEHLSGEVKVIVPERGVKVRVK